MFRHSEFRVEFFMDNRSGNFELQRRPGHLQKPLAFTAFFLWDRPAPSAGAYLHQPPILSQDISYPVLQMRRRTPNSNLVEPGFRLTGSGTCFLTPAPHCGSGQSSLVWSL